MAQTLDGLAISAMMPVGTVSHPQQQAALPLRPPYAYNGFWAQAAQTGSIVGWGKQVVGADTSAGFTAIAAGGYHSLGLKACLHRPIGNIDDNCRVDLVLQRN
jgi:hypothetical protein